MNKTYYKDLKVFETYKKDYIKNLPKNGNYNWNSWEPDSICTLCYILDKKNNKVLLIRRKKKGFGSNKISGPGGHMEKGETPLLCAIRETQEEVGLRPINPSLVGILCFAIPNNNILGYVYIATEYEGKLKETSEAQPFWCPLDELPLNEMFNDDLIWLPRTLKGVSYTFFGVCHQDGTMTDFSITSEDNTFSGTTFDIEKNKLSFLKYLPQREKEI
ncbi:MAG: 8-oxo-dGTP diphosphatase [Sphaerochaetaceae bacterium]|nr:8-oxo-dGTP diphosphatase [Sphaerochaetaceae bacterium]